MGPEHSLFFYECSGPNCFKTTLATSRHTKSSLPLLPSGPGGVHKYLLREDQGGICIIRKKSGRSINICERKGSEHS